MQKIYSVQSDRQSFTASGQNSLQFQAYLSCLEKALGEDSVLSKYALTDLQTSSLATKFDIERSREKYTAENMVCREM